MSQPALVEAFAAFPARLAAAAKARTAEWRPVPEGEWGPNETIRHLIAVEDEVWRARFARLVREDDPHWTWTEPGLAPGYDDSSLLAFLTVFARRRARTVATIRALDETGWTRFGTHATYGGLDVAGLLRLAIDHDEEHAASLSAAEPPNKAGRRVGDGRRERERLLEGQRATLVEQGFRPCPEPFPDQDDRVRDVQVLSAALVTVSSVIAWAAPARRAASCARPARRARWLLTTRPAIWLVRTPEVSRSERVR